MRAAVLVDVGRIELRDVPCEDPGPRDVLVRVTAVGLCGTDFHIFAGHANYNRDERGRPIPLAREPQILGHEVAGVVEAAGASVRDLRPGERVVIDQGRNCVSAARSPLCEYCATGDSHQCESYREHGITGLPGGAPRGLSGMNPPPTIPEPPLMPAVSSTAPTSARPTPAADRDFVVRVVRVVAAGES